MDNIKDSYSLKDKNNLQVDRVTTITETLTLNYDDLINKRVILQARKDANNAAIDLELADVNNLIDQCTQLGIVSVVVPVSITDNSISNLAGEQVNGSK